MSLANNAPIPVFAPWPVTIISVSKPCLRKAPFCSATQSAPCSALTELRPMRILSSLRALEPKNTINRTAKPIRTRNIKANLLLRERFDETARFDFAQQAFIFERFRIGSFCLWIIFLDKAQYSLDAAQ